MSSVDVKGEVHLRPYQENAIARVRALVAGGARRILVVASTGAGKTVCFAHISAEAARRGNSVLIIAHRRELIHQTYRKLCDAGLAESQVGVLMATDARRRPTAPVQVASVDSLRYRSKPPAQIVIVDEAHRELAKSYADIRALYPNAIHLGFTATPFRADNRGLGEFYEDLVVVASMRELITQGYLVEPRVFTVPDGDLPDLRGVRTRGGDYDQTALGEAVDQQRLVGNIVEHWQKHAAGVRTVAFAVSVLHSKHIVERFREAGVAAEHLEGATPTSDRDAILARLDRGETRIVSNVGVCSEGWDCLDSETEILAPTGWKRSGEVERGDSIYALNPQTGLIDVVIATDCGERNLRANEKMVRVESQHVDIRTTAGHRFYVKRRASLDAPFEIVSGEELSHRSSRYALPLAANVAREYPGLPLSDDELRFVAWFMTDGGFQRDRSAVGITQAKHYHTEIRSLLRRLELDHRERVRPPPAGTFRGNLAVHEFLVPKGTRSGAFARRGWFDRFAAFLDKDVALLLHSMTRRQFAIFWQELLKGDGEQLDKSGWLWCDRKEQVDAYTQMAATRGFASAFSERVTKSGRTVYRVSVRDRAWITSDPQDPRAARISLQEPRVGERVWCVSNRCGTLITRRRGRIVVLGNCPPVKCAILARPTKSTGLYLQQAGRILRPWNDTRAIILDHAGCAREHGLPQDDREYSLESKPKQKRSVRVDLTRTCEECLAVLPAQTRVCPECGHVLVAEREAPTELAGELVEAAPKPLTNAMHRTYFEQMRALARAKRKDVDWAIGRFAAKYGAPPPSEWIQSAWSSP